MTTFALIHGAWGSGWHWAGVPEELRARGHDVVAPDLPCDDTTATFDDYAEVVLSALAHVPGEDVVVVGFSLGGNTAPLVAARRPVRELVYLAAMVPVPGMSLNDQFSRRGRLLLRDYLAGIEGPDRRGLTRWADFEVYHRTGCHDCSEAVARERFERSRAQAIEPYRHPCTLAGHPAVPTCYVMCADERLMDNSFWRQAVPERLGVAPVEIPGSHSPMASQPERVVEVLTSGLAATRG